MAAGEREPRKPEYRIPESRGRDIWIPITIGVGVVTIAALTLNYVEQDVSASEPPLPGPMYLPTRVPTPLVHFSNIPMSVNPHRHQRRRSADFDAQD